MIPCLSHSQYETMRCMQNTKDNVQKKNQAQHVRAVCLDFNWDLLKRPASPGLYNQADPQEHLDWHLSHGVNVIHTFCVSYNGYAWYKDSGHAPVTPGLQHDFLPTITAGAHREGLRVMGYFCLGANPYWSLRNPGRSYSRQIPNDINIPLAEDYLDYFCDNVADTLKKVPIDGFMIDWVNRPRRSKEWKEIEAELYRSLMGEALPTDKPIPDDVMLEYDRRAIDRAWGRIRDTVDRVSPSTLIWTNHPLSAKDKTLWENTRVLQEVDWILNESEDTSLLQWLEDQCGNDTRIIQCLSGWETHDANAALDALDTDRDLYGFCKVAPNTGLPSPDISRIDYNNIHTLTQLYSRLRTKT